MAKWVVESLIKERRVIRGYLGVQIRDLSPERARQLNIPEPQGALVALVVPGSPAERAGLQADDVIVKIGDREVHDMRGLRNTTASLEIGSKTPMSFYRAGRLQTVEVTIGALPDEPPNLGKRTP
jgi:serine protease Do